MDDEAMTDLDYGKNGLQDPLFFSLLEINHMPNLGSWLRTLFKSIKMFCGRIDCILQNILHIQCEFEEYFLEYCQSHNTLLWMWLMQWVYTTYDI